MLKLFRKIRQELLEKGKVQQYLLYAIGEIFLVVIGILIALQINNWNENRKLKQEEVQMLSEIKLALASDLANVLPEGIKRNQEDMTSINVLLDFIETPSNYNDSLKPHFRVLSRGIGFTPQTSTYKILEVKGVDLISDTKLKKEILTIYNLDYPIIALRTNNKLHNIREYGRPIVRKELRTTRRGLSLYEPINREQLAANPILWNTLNSLHNNSNNLINLLETQVIKVEKLIQLIDEEL